MAHPRAQRLDEGLLGSKAFGEKAGTVNAGRKIFPFHRRQNTPRKPVAVTVQGLLDTPYRNNVGTNPVYHLATATISAFISATARSQPTNNACATMA